ncbi:hypothetical protein DO72_1177 [Burkholderia pseudomallei]|nr:hypothetical protein DO72_1177 [Burkholderia pseudomallei]
MRPIANRPENAAKSEAQATVTSLSSYRSRDRVAANQTKRAAQSNLEARHLRIASHLSSRLESNGTYAVAAALVLLRADGSLDSTTTGLEPEFVPFLTRGLKGLTDKLSRARHPRPPSPRQRGSATLAAIATLTFVTATYINEYPLIDAALSFAGQFCAAMLWNRRR